MRNLFKKDKKNLLTLAATLFVLLAIPVTVYISLNLRSFEPRAVGPEIRGTSGDLWADTILGKRDFTEISQAKTLPDKVFIAGGVAVDRTNNRAYILDGSHSRILGINLATCLATTNPCSADPSAGGIVIGQPSATDFGACNLDASFQNYPVRAPAAANTICTLQEGTRSTAEILPFVQMTIDNAGRLIFPDIENHRILIYDTPYTNSPNASQQIGQADFFGNLCNRGNTLSPTESSFCFSDPGGRTGYSGIGTAIEPATGALWIADNGNNRVLRFPKDPNLPGRYKTSADLVLGQPNFTQGTYQWGTGQNQLSNPNSLVFGPSGELYVADPGNNRIQVFNSPFTSSMNATRTFGSLTGSIGAVDPSGVGFWQNNYELKKLTLWSWSGTLLKTYSGSESLGGGIGIDSQGNLMVAAYLGIKNIALYRSSQIDKPKPDRWLFKLPTEGYENSRIEDSSGVTIAGGQLFASDMFRVLFWNNPSSLTNGKPADGCLVEVSCSSVNRTYGGFVGQLKSDNSDRVWVRSGKDVKVYKAPVTSGALPIKTISYPLNVLGGGQISAIVDKDGSGIVPTSDGKFLWFSESTRHRVLRIRDPLTNPVVDLILGQTDLNSTLCNRGLVGEGQTGTAYPDTLCYPGSLSLDRLGNLYVSDSALESSGNKRLLMFASGLFPTNNSSLIFAASDPKYNATKIFPTSPISGYRFAPWEPAFDSRNRMVLGLNAYWDGYFVAYYNDPTDPNKIAPDGMMREFNPDVLGAFFDQNDNLYLANHNRGRVQIFNTPFVEPVGNEAPTVSIASHKNDTWYKGGIQKIQVNAGDDYNSVGRVEFFVDNNLVYTDYVLPFETNYNFGNFDGNHTILVKAYDQFKMGQTSITVKTDHQGPTRDVVWNSPTNGATVSGRIPVSINADDLVSGTKRVDFFVDGRKVASDDIPDSYGFWWNTSSVGNGPHLLEAKAYDQPDNVTTLSTSVNVNNSSIVADPINQVYLNPVSPGTYAEYSEQRLYPSISTEEFEAFDEEVPDDLWSFVFTNGNDVRYMTTGKIDSSKIPSNATISSVEVWARAQNVAGSPNLKIMLRAGGVDNFSDPVAIVDTAFTNYKNVWTTNPAGGAWTLGALADAEIGVQAWHGIANAHRVTSVWMVVNYTIGTTKIGDLNNDGRVGSADLAILISTWGSTADLRADLNTDGKVGSADLAMLISRWGS